VGEGEAQESRPARGLTPIEALESYSSSHAEKIEDLLEWPRRRFIKAFEAWSRRSQVEEWNRRKLDHIAAIYGNPYVDGEKLPGMLDQVEDFYEGIKRELMVPRQELERIDEELMNSPFMAASRRNLAKSIERANQDVIIPGQASFQRLP
jgi:hypothetical protein